MNIVEKLNLQPVFGELILIKEGFFYRAYNESCYILTQLLEQPLKIEFRRIAMLDNNVVVMCGFPCSKLFERLPKAELTAFGAKLKHHFHLQGYSQWFNKNYRAHNVSNR